MHVLRTATLLIPDSAEGTIGFPINFGRDISEITIHERLGIGLPEKWKLQSGILAPKLLLTHAGKLVQP